MSTSSSVPATVDLVHYAGDTLRRSIAVTDTDITAWTWKADICESTDEDAPVIASFILTPITSKEVEFSLPASVTATLNGTYSYDIQAVIDNGDTLTITAGKLIVRPDVTK